jgi:hypothetical protein
MLDRNPATRISAEEALAHPWFHEMLGYSPSLSGEIACNNVVGFTHSRHGSPECAGKEQLQHDSHAAAECYRHLDLEALLVEGVPQLALPTRLNQRPAAGSLQSNAALVAQACS